MTPTLNAAAICPLPEPLISTPDDGGDAAYMALATKLGVRNAFIVRRELENVLRQESIHVYDNAKVKLYMDGLVEKENARLRSEWEKTASPEKLAEQRKAELLRATQTAFERLFSFGLWASDSPLRITWGWRPLRGVELLDGIPGAYGDLYPHAVPFAALTTMETILEKMPDARFLVSDYQAETPDPFLMVTHKLLGTDGFIVERWNEPSFR